MMSKSNSGEILNKPDSLRKLAEKLLLEEKYKLPSIVNTTETQKLLHELQVHQIELELSNEGLRALNSELEEAREQYRELFNNAPVGYLVLDTKGCIVRANQTAAKLLYVEKKLLKGQPLSNFCAFDDRDVLYLHFRHAKELKVSHIAEFHLFSDNGEERIIRLETKAEEGNESNKLRSVLQDVTERVRIESFQRLAASVIENTPESVMISDNQNCIISVNPAFTQITGYSSEEAVGQKPSLLNSGIHNESFYNELWLELKSEGRWRGEIWNRRKNGDIYPEWLNINVIKDPQGKISHYVGIFSDITHQEHVKARLHELAYFDPLTNLPNRQLYRDRLSNDIHRAHRDKTQLALLFLDVDRFKNINDSLGHNAGDALIKFVAQILSQCVRESDTVARLGGDEFTLILTEIHTTADAVKVSDKILHRFRNEPFIIDGREFFITVSIGISLYPKDADNTDNLSRAADIAMYRSKEMGRDRYSFFSNTEGRRIEERLKLESDLRNALEQQQLYLLYQPQVNTNNGQIVGCEALLRWKHPQLGLIPPDQFIPVAEETGMIRKIGHWVIEQVLHQAQVWYEQGYTDLCVSFNLSPLQLKPISIEAFLELFEKNDSSRRCAIEMEITESVLMEYTDTIEQMFEQLHSSEINIAIDDFGTGCSALSSLKRIPVDTIKIDRSFIHNIKDSGDDIDDDIDIVEAIIILGKSLGLKVVAEGVENQQQLSFLQSHHCDWIQGFLFSKPVSIQEMNLLLEKGAIVFNN